MKFILRNCSNKFYEQENLIPFLIKNMGEEIKKKYIKDIEKLKTLKLPDYNFQTDSTEKHKFRPEESNTDLNISQFNFENFKSSDKALQTIPSSNPIERFSSIIDEAKLLCPLIINQNVPENVTSLLNKIKELNDYANSELKNYLEKNKHESNINK